MNSFLKFTCSQNEHSETFMVIFRYTQKGEKLLNSPTHTPSWGQTRRCSTFMYPLLSWKQHKSSYTANSLSVLFVAIFLAFLCGFLGWFYSLKWPPNIVLKYYLVPKHKQTILPCRNKYSLDKLCSDMRYSTIGCEFNVNQQYISNKVTL